MGAADSFFVLQKTYVSIPGSCFTCPTPLCDKARERSKRQTQQEAFEGKKLSQVLFGRSLSVSKPCVCDSVKHHVSGYRRSRVFECLEWTESLVPARLSWTTRALLEPILLDRLWRLTAGYLKEILEDLGRRPERHHVLCFFQAQTFEDSVLWEPRGTEVFAENRRRELRRSPLCPYADLIHAWGLRLFVVRRFCPALASELLVETWELEGLLYGWRIFAAVHKHTRVPLTQVAPDPDSETEQEALERTYWA